MNKITKETGAGGRGVWRSLLGGEQLGEFKTRHCLSETKHIEDMARLYLFHSFYLDLYRLYGLYRYLCGCSQKLTLKTYQLVREAFNADMHMLKNKRKKKKFIIFVLPACVIKISNISDYRLQHILETCSCDNISQIHCK